MEALKSAISEEFIQVEQRFNDPQMTEAVYPVRKFLGNAPLDSLPFEQPNGRRIFAVVTAHNQPKDPDW